MLNSQLNQMTKSVKMLTNGTDKLEEILQVGQNVGNKSGLGFVEAKKSGADKALYFPVHDAGACCEQLQELLRRRPGFTPQDNLSRFNWRTAAEQTIEFYRKFQ